MKQKLDNRQTNIGFFYHSIPTICFIFPPFAIVGKALTDYYIRQSLEENTVIRISNSDFWTHAIARSLSAFANTEGGRLLIGVKDNGKIAGVRSDEEIYMIEAAATMYCKPKVELETQTYKRRRLYWNTY